MSIASEITRIQNAKASLKASINAKSTTQITNETLEDYASFVDNIPSGGVEPTMSTRGTSGIPAFHFLVSSLPSINVTISDFSYAFKDYYASSIPKLNFSSNISSLNNAFFGCQLLTSLDLSGITNWQYIDTNYAFRRTYKLAVLDLSGGTFNPSNSFYVFNDCGTSCLAEDGAYADGIPYIYVKDVESQTFILNLASSSRPSSWTTNNVVIKQ